MQFSQLVILFTLLILCGAAFPTNAQRNKSVSLKVVATKPSVYISFDHRGKQVALFEGESDQRIWLRLHNNTKLDIFLCKFSVSKEYGEIGLFYSVESAAFFKEKDRKIPVGYGPIDSCDVFTLHSGKSVVFSIPSEHLDKGLIIRTQFFYGWTGNWKEDIYERTTHYTGFGNDELPT